MYKKTFIIASIFIFYFSIDIKAQRITQSIYSRYGLGDKIYATTGSSKGMGNTGIGVYDQFSVNLLNPAGISALRKQMFIFDAGMDFKYTKTSSSKNSQINTSNNFSYLVGAFSAQSWWSTSFGLVPYSTAGYTIRDTTITNYEDKELYKYQVINGDGGINKVFITNSFKIKNHFAVGLTASYLFGTLTRELSSIMPEEDYYSGIFNKNKKQFNGFLFNIGAQYTDSIFSKTDSLDNKFNYTLGVVFDNEAKINMKNINFIARDMNLLGNSYNDTVLLDTTVNKKVSIPIGYGIGASFTIDDKLTIALDYYHKKWQNFTIPEQINSFVNSDYYAAGFQFVNDKYSTSFFKTIRYRLGGHYTNTYLKIGDYQMNEMAVHFGFGVPIKSFLANFSFELGTRGTTDYGLFEEKYALFHLNFSMHDLWFVKRKFQ